MKRKHIVKFSDVATTGLGLFLIVGLSGCDSKCQKGNTTYTGDRVQECLNSGGMLISGSSSGSKSSGYFGNGSSSTHSSGG